MGYQELAGGQAALSRRADELQGPVAWQLAEAQLEDAERHEHGARGAELGVLGRLAHIDEHRDPLRPGGLQATGGLDDGDALDGWRLFHQSMVPSPPLDRLAPHLMDHGQGTQEPERASLHHVAVRHRRDGRPGRATFRPTSLARCGPVTETSGPRLRSHGLSDDQRAVAHRGEDRLAVDGAVGDPRHVSLEAAVVISPL